MTITMYDNLGQDDLFKLAGLIQRESEYIRVKEVTNNFRFKHGILEQQIILELEYPDPVRYLVTDFRFIDVWINVPEVE